jgi:hypothetical protein
MFGVPSQHVLAHVCHIIQDTVPTWEDVVLHGFAVQSVVEMQSRISKP